MIRFKKYQRTVRDQGRFVIALILGVVLAVGGSVYATSIGSNVSVSGTLTSSGAFSVDTTSATSTFSTGGLNVGSGQFIIQQNSGRVGISTTTPSQLFSIQGNLYASGTGYFGDTLTATSTALLGNGGANVGIGATSTLTARLSVQGAGTGTGLMVYMADSAGATRFLIEDRGRVGIGTSSPAQLLAVHGDALLGTTTVKGLIATGTVTVDGNIGKSTTTPVQELSITGDGLFGGTSGTTTVTIESSATNTGGCINLRGSNGTMVRIYATTSPAALTVSGESYKNLVVESGSCQ